MHNFSLPLENPFLVFMLTLLIVLAIPVLLRKSKVPAIVGLIISGIIIGPHFLGLIEENDTIELFSHVGLLYIMFLAGLEIEFIEFKKNSVKAVFFGILNFAIPFGFGYYSGIYIIDLGQIPSVLIGIMLASNTLVAFPVISELEIGKTSPIITAISGTVIADSLVLVILAFITAFIGKGDPNNFLWIFFTSFSAFVFFVFYLLPKISKWFFKVLSNDGNLQFVYVFSALFAASFTAELAGAEPIIGAFFAGLALNKLIPSSSILMNRIDFVGNSLFVPFFLISVGMLVDLKVLFTGFTPILYALVFIIVALSSKWFAALFTKLVFKQSRTEMKLIFGLTSARAAATLAIVLVGMEYELLNNDVFNSVILLILVTSLFSSFLTEKAGKDYLEELKEKLKNKKPSSKDKKHTINRILIPFVSSNIKNIRRQIDIATLIHNIETDEPLYPLAVIDDDKESKSKVKEQKPVFNKIKTQAASNGFDIKELTRIDSHFSAAVSRTSKEFDISDIILKYDFSEDSNTINEDFGNNMDEIINNSCINILITNLPRPINLTEKMLVFVPENAEKEVGFHKWIDMLIHLNKQLSASFVFYIPKMENNDLESKISKAVKGFDNSFVYYENTSELFEIHEDSEYALLVYINSRKDSESYNSTFYNLTFNLDEKLTKFNLLNIYPSSEE